MDLLQYLLNGDLFGFVDAVYFNLLGEIWYAIPLLLIFLPIYIKTESIEFCAILWVLIGSLLISLLPALAATTGTVLLVLGLGILLYRLVERVLS